MVLLINLIGFIVTAVCRESQWDEFRTDLGGAQGWWVLGSHLGTGSSPEQFKKKKIKKKERKKEREKKKTTILFTLKVNHGVIDPSWWTH